MASSSQCYHCGLPNDSKQIFETQILGDTRQLCCPGCLAVAQAIVDNGLEDYYQFRTEPANKSDDSILSTLDELGPTINANLTSANEMQIGTGAAFRAS